MKIYLIEHSEGEYEYYDSWISNGFFDEDKAKKYVEEYNKKLREDNEQYAICEKCINGKYTSKSDIISNCKIGVKEEDIIIINTKKLYIGCKNMIDSRLCEHDARIVEVDVE